MSEVTNAELTRRIDHLDAQILQVNRREAALVLTAVSLTVIALCLVVLTLRVVSVPSAQAGTSMSCTGDLKANAWGGMEPSIGGYKVNINCSN